MRILFTVLFAGVFIFLNSCKKYTEECKPNTEPIELTSNGPVIAGWPLVLTANEDNENYVYRWKGPNGWSTETQYSFEYPQQWRVTKDSATFNDAGNYLVELISEGCVVKRGTVHVEVIAPPPPPCSVANNSSTTTLGGVGGTTYTTVSHTGGSDYTVYATNGSQTINFRFKNGQPKPGIYRSFQGFFPSEDNQVAVYIQAGFYDFHLKADYAVHVNEVNGKLQFAFCSGDFTNPVGSNTITISAKVTLP